MSRFYASIEGQAKTAATRRGSKNIDGHIRGWNKGVSVHGYINEAGEDCFNVWVTGGSNGMRGNELAFRIEGDQVIPVADMIKKIDK